MSTTDVSVNRQKLIDSYNNAVLSNNAANDAVRKAEQMLREAQAVQTFTALALRTLVLILQELPS